MSTLTDAAPRIIIITGNMAAGKSSVAQALAERLPRSVHLRGDLFRRMIVNGQAEMNFDLSSEAQQQLHLRYRIAATVAALYYQAGFTVVYQDIIIGTDLASVVTTFQPYPLLLVVLCPSPEIIAEREAARSKTGYEDEASIMAFDHILHSATPRLGYWLDTSELTIQETVDNILNHLSDAAILSEA